MAGEMTTTLEQEIYLWTTEEIQASIDILTKLENSLDADITVAKGILDALNAAWEGEAANLAKGNVTLKLKTPLESVKAGVQEFKKALGDVITAYTTAEKSITEQIKTLDDAVTTLQVD